jgi:hypothetical protein
MWSLEIVNVIQLLQCSERLGANVSEETVVALCFNRVGSPSFRGISFTLFLLLIAVVGGGGIVQF